MSESLATEATQRSLAQAVAGLRLADEQNFEDASRGFLARSYHRQITAADGRILWDLDSYAFLDGDAPPTAHPGLWR
ncbi:hypothetical protein [Streptomyces sp. NPDC048720]|uniref:hypothetical protein n=1 Tax=Streptomyces sp. NPDC048720 TaxID=3365588 RepID=UPI00371BDBE3